MTQSSITGANVPDVAHTNHGRTVAAWVTNGAVTAGVLLAGVGMALPARELLWAGIVVAALGLVVGAVLKALGFGQPRR